MCTPKPVFLGRINLTRVCSYWVGREHCFTPHRRIQVCFCATVCSWCKFHDKFFTNMSCIIILCFHFSSLEHLSLILAISTGTMLLVYVGAMKLVLKPKFHWLFFFFFSFLFQDLISLGVRAQIIPENLTLLLV